MKLITFNGYASLFDVPDVAGDIVAPGAFRNSLKERDHTKVRMLLQHDPSAVVGGWTRVEEDDVGLFVEGCIELLKDCDAYTAHRSLSVAKSIIDRALSGLSIGFSTRKFLPRQDAPGRILTELSLAEVSLVRFPMLPAARIKNYIRSEYV